MRPSLLPAFLLQPPQGEHHVNCLSSSSESALCLSLYTLCKRLQFKQDYVGKGFLNNAEEWDSAIVVVVTGHPHSCIKWWCQRRAYPWAHSLFPSTAVETGACGAEQLPFSSPDDFRRNVIFTWSFSSSKGIDGRAECLNRGQDVEL